MASNPWTLAEVDYAVRQYRNDVSAAEIGGVLGRYRDAVIRVLRANGVQIRPRGGPSLERREECPSFTRMVEEARFGSTQLLAALERAGVRP